MYMNSAWIFVNVYIAAANMYTYAHIQRHPIGTATLHTVAAYKLSIVGRPDSIPYVCNLN